MGFDSIRRRILERRALFIGSAIAGLGCGPSRVQPASPPAEVAYAYDAPKWQLTWGTRMK